MDECSFAILRLSIVQSRAQDCLTPRLVAPMKLNEVIVTFPFLSTGSSFVSLYHMMARQDVQSTYSSLLIATMWAITKLARFKSSLNLPLHINIDGER
ncbi:hypothetical protein BLOT_009649 [Blomia tropicalis]|nr:hypothetical protein BLOT_009649 [Blomia tropicalis]